MQPQTLSRSDIRNLEQAGWLSPRLIEERTSSDGTTQYLIAGRLNGQNVKRWWISNYGKWAEASQQ